MKKPKRKIGFQAVQEEEARIKKEQELRKGKLWRLFFPKNCGGDYEINVRFLTDEPFCFREHNVVTPDGKYQTMTCLGEAECPQCAEGSKSSFKGAFLVIDRTEFEIDEKDANGKPTGKKVKVKDRLKLLVRGKTDLGALARLQKKYGLLDRDWSIAKTGSGTSTAWNFDRGDNDPLTEEEIQALLPEKYRGKDFYDILEEQIYGSEDTTETDNKEATSDSDTDTDVVSGVQSFDDEEEPVKPTHKRTLGRKVSNKKMSKLPKK